MFFINCYPSIQIKFIYNPWNLSASTDVIHRSDCWSNINRYYVCEWIRAPNGSPKCLYESIWHKAFLQNEKSKVNNSAVWTLMVIKTDLCQSYILMPKLSLYSVSGRWGQNISCLRDCWCCIQPRLDNEGRVTWHFVPSLILVSEESDCKSHCKSDSFKKLRAIHTAGSSQTHIYFCFNTYINRGAQRHETRWGDFLFDAPVKQDLADLAACVVLCDPAEEGKNN